MTISERIKLLESKAVIFSAAGMADLAEACYQKAAKLTSEEATRPTNGEARRAAKGRD